MIPLTLKGILPALVKNKTKLVTNAGGLDPLGLKLAIEDLAQKQGLSDKVVVAAVYGDDLLDRYSTLEKSQKIVPFSPFGDHRQEKLPKDTEFLSINAYVGANAIKEALDAGANIVVTGRVVDSALVLGPCLHEFGWNIARDLDKVASASLAGHIIECGAQATGGNFTDWKDGALSDYGGWANAGYGIVEIGPDGDFSVTKPKETGGVVSVLSVAEQMLYEVLDPAHYLLPDVCLDLTNVTLQQESPTRVKLRGAKGSPPTAHLKCTAISQDGFVLTGELGIVGDDARLKAHHLGRALISRAEATLKERGAPPFTETRIEAIGSEDIFGKYARTGHSREVRMRLSAAHPVPQALLLVGMDLAYSATSTAPAITGGGAGRPHPSPRFVAESFLIHKDSVPVSYKVGNNEAKQVYHQTAHCEAIDAPKPSQIQSPPLGSLYSDAFASRVSLPLPRICVGRSGDKGDTANIAFISRKPEYYSLLKEQVTEAVIADVLGHLISKGGSIQRYELPGSHAINFVVSHSLGGGGLKSLHFDKQAKAYAQICLSVVRINAPRDLLHLL